MQMPEPVASTQAVGIIDGFLDWTHEHRPKTTYDWYTQAPPKFYQLARGQDAAYRQITPFSYPAMG